MPQVKARTLKVGWIMPLRSLKPEEIDDLIDQDKICWVACRNPKLELAQGKFVKGEPLDGGKDGYLYSFCVFKKGVKTGFLPAQMWLIDDVHAVDSHKDIVGDTLAKMFKK